jgi:hypothetical protein
MQFACHANRNLIISENFPRPHPCPKKSAFAPEIVLTSTREIAEIPLPGVPKERLAIVLFGVWKARS